MPQPRKAPRFTNETLHRHIAQQVIDMIGRDELSFFREFAVPQPAQNGVSGHVYRGSNILTTTLDMLIRGSTDPRYVPRSAMRGDNPVGRVRKGEKGVPIQFYATREKTDSSGAPELNSHGDPKRFGFAKIYYVWHVSQLEDLDESRLKPLPEPPRYDSPAIIHARTQDFIDGSGVPFRTGQRAFYSEMDDTITMPPVDHIFQRDDLGRGEIWQSIALHELIHATGAKKRLDRESMRSYARSKESRAFEELIAELGSCIAASHLGLRPEPRAENAAYIAGWVKLLTDRPKAIFDAASAAQAAFDRLIDMQPKEQAA